MRLLSPRPLAVLVTLLSACTAGSTGDPCCETVFEDSGDSGDTDGPDFTGVQRVILVTLDTLRADRFGSEKMPFLAGMETEGVVWSHAWAQTWTYAGMGTAITGRTPATWGVDSYNRMSDALPTLSTEVPTMAEMLGSRGWASAYWASNLVGIETGLDRGYDEVSTMGVRQADWPDDVSAWLTETSGQPQFLHIHMNDVHDPYNEWGQDCAADMEALPLEDCPYDLLEDTDQGLSRAVEDVMGGQFGEWSPEFEACSSLVTTLYDCEVEALDAVLSRVFGRLEEDGFLEDTLVVIAPDHGEGLFDPNPNHGFDLRAPITRSRVLFWAPGHLPPDVVEARVGLDDILPSIDALLGLELGMETTGMPYWESGSDRIITGYNFAKPNVGDITETHYAVNGNHHYIRGTNVDEQLYDYLADPGERSNLIGTLEIPADLAAAVDAQAAITAPYLEAP